MPRVFAEDGSRLRSSITGFPSASVCRPFASPFAAKIATLALDLQAVLDRCYEEGRYDGDIDYREEPDPPLSSDDARWAEALLREQGRR